MNACVHRTKTAEWARELGLGEPAAQAIAAADQAADGPGFPRNRYHLRPPLLLGRDRRGPVAAAHLEQAAQAAGEGDCPRAWEQLGYGLHALQDQAAHGGWWLLGIHWGPWLDDPERTFLGGRDREHRRLQAVARVTKDYLEQALSRPELAACLLA